LRLKNEERLRPPEDGYDFGWPGIAYDLEDEEFAFAGVGLQTTEGADTAADILHPLVDYLIKVLCHFQASWVDFGREMSGDDERVVPCSGQSLQQLLSSNTIHKISWGLVTIGEDLIRAFAQHNDHTNLILRFDNCIIQNYGLLGQSLHNNRSLRSLDIESTLHDPIVLMLQELRGHPTLYGLHLALFFDNSLGETESQLLWDAVNGMDNLNELEVSQASGHDSGMQLYTFHGMCKRLSTHPSIQSLKLDYRLLPVWTDLHLETIMQTLRVNKRIIRINMEYIERIDIAAKWNSEVPPLLRWNALQFRIDQILSHTDLSTKQAQLVEPLLQCPHQATSIQWQKRRRPTS